MVSAEAKEALLNPASPAPQRDNYDKIKQAESSDGELTEFEEGVKKWMGFNRTQPNDEDLKMIRKAAKELLSIARKQIAKEIKGTIMQTSICYVHGLYTQNDMNRAYFQCVVDILNLIKKG